MDTAHQPAPPAIRLLRFADLRAANVVTSWPQLRRLVEGKGFPPGYLLSPAVRVWDASAIEAWLEERRQASAGAAADLPEREPVAA